MVSLQELIQMYFPRREWENAYQVAMGESGGNPQAIGDQYPIRGVLAPSYGYFQIRGLPGRPPKEALLNPEFNVKYAAKMQQEQGWNPWTVAKNLGLVKGIQAKETSNMDKYSQFKSSMIRKYPNMTSAQLKSLDAFIEKKRAEEAVQKGILTREEAYEAGADIETLEDLPSEEEREAEAKRKEEETGKIKDMEYEIVKMGEIYNILDEYSGEDIAGIMPAIKAKLFAGFSKESDIGKELAPSKGTNLLQAAMSDYNTKLFEIAGKQFTGPERVAIEGLILLISDDEERIKDKIEQAERMLRAKAGGLDTELPSIKTTRAKVKKEALEEYGEEEVNNFLADKAGTEVQQTGDGGIGPIQQGENPLLYALAKTQEYLGKSQALPIAYGLMGGQLGPIGTGMGTMAGTEMRKSLAEGKPYLPWQVPSGESLKKGAVAGGIHALLQPFKTVGGVKNWAQDRFGRPIPGSQIAENISKIPESLKIPTSQIPRVSKLTETGKKAFQGRTISPQEIATRKSAAGRIAFSPGHQVRKPAASAYEAGVHGILSEYQPTAVNILDDILTKMYGAKRFGKNLFWRLAPYIGLGQILSRS